MIETQLDLFWETYTYLELSKLKELLKIKFQFNRIYYNIIFIFAGIWTFKCFKYILLGSEITFLAKEKIKKGWNFLAFKLKISFIYLLSRLKKENRRWVCVLR